MNSDKDCRVGQFTRLDGDGDGCGDGDWDLDGDYDNKFDSDGDGDSCMVNQLQCLVGGMRGRLFGFGWSILV